MEWIWLVFILFSIITRLVEKLGTMREKTGEAAEKTEAEPVYVEDDVPVFAGPKQGEDFSRPEREKAGLRRKNGLPDPVWPDEDGDLGDASVLAGEFGENYDDLVDGRAERALPTGEDWPGQQLRDPGTLRTIMALAHVLKRPDFKTLPWQRRL